MRKTTIALCVSLFAAHLQAQEMTETAETTPVAVATASAVPEYRDPLADLDIDPNASQYQFERSSLRALNVQDPLEGFNRRIYRFNGQFDQLIYLPVVRTYEWATPTFVRTGVSNVFSNLADVPNLANSILQRKGQRSMRTTARLLFNTTLGVVGLFDVAKAM
ncbi:MAG: MlaA family lipoprotein, partial [Halopseudomonas sp.]